MFQRIAILILNLIVVLTVSSSRLYAQISSFSEKSLSSQFNYTIQFWNSENGLPQNSIMSCIQTYDGFLWMATTNGLVRFDGFTFKVYNTQNNPELTDNFFSKLFEDSNHNLWLISSNYQLIKYTNGIFEKQVFKFSPSNNTITALTENDNKELIVSFANGDACILKGKQLIPVFKSTEGKINNIIYSHGVYFTTNKGIFLYKNNEISLIKNIVPGENINFKKAQDETLWAYSNNGLYKINGWEVQKNSLPNEIKGNIYINDILIEENNKMWLSSSNGIYILDGLSYQRITTDLGLPSNAITTLIRDKENNIWIGTHNAGICKLKYKTMINYSKEDGLMDDGCGPIINYKNGSILISNFCNKITKWQDGKLSLFNKIHIGCVWSMLYDNENNLFLGTYSKDLYTYKEDKPEKYFSAGKNISEVYLALFKDKEKALWIGTKKGLFCNKNGAFIQVKPNEIKCSVTYITEDSKGKIWFCSENGLGVIDNNELKLYTTKDGLSNNKTRHIYEDKEGVFWISTYGGGINRLIDNTFFAYNSKEEIFDNSASCIVEDQYDNFWISTNHGIYSTKRSDLNDYADNKTPFLSALHYGREDGMKNSECNGGFQGAGLETQDGKILFPTVGGLVVINPTNKYSDIKPSNIIMESIVMDNKNFSRIDTISEIPREINKIEFNFTAPYFGDNHNLLFQHQLEGFDEDWSKPDNKRTVSYLNLPSGDYNLKLRIYGNLKEYNFLFTIPQPIWKTKLFFLVIIGLSLFFCFMIIRLRTKRRKKREEEKIKINKHYAALELKTLQGQMNPHFLFNCLNTIKYFIAVDDKVSAGKYLSKFSKMIRLFLEHSNSNSIKLENEINLLTHYIEMEQLRLENGFTFITHIDQNLSLKEVEMPAMILQPFIENAIHHGLKNLNKHGVLTLCFLIEKQFLKIIIEDNGVGREKAAELKLLSPKEHKSMGMQLITERIQILNYIKNTSISVNVKDKLTNGIQPNGTCVIVKIPLSYN